MTTPLVNVFARIQSLLEGTNPPTRDELSYRLIDDHESPNDEGGDRVFWFQVSGHRPIGERGNELTQTEWSFELHVRLSGSGYDARSFPVALAVESAWIRRQLDKNDAWGSGVLEVVLDDLTVTPDGEDAVLSWSCRGATEEAD